MVGKLPKDCPARAVSTRARSLVVYKLNSEQWEWHEQTGSDHGIDMILELIDKEEFVNKKIEAQIKGTRNLKILKSGDISFDLDVKTINYALSGSSSFILFLVDVDKEDVYYLPLQDYFIENVDRFLATENNMSTVAVHIPPGNILNSETNILCDIANNVYVRDSEGTLQRIS